MFKRLVVFIAILGMLALPVHARNIVDGVEQGSGGTTLTQEQVEDYVGGMVTGNTETGITVEYQDSDGTLDFTADIHDAVTLGTANGLSLSTQALSLAAATNASPGAATAAQITALEAIDTEAELEALLELQDLQGAVTDGQVPNTITVDTAAACSGNAATVTNATLTTALTIDTGTVTLTGNVANTSALTIGAGAVSISGTNTGDNTNATTVTCTDNENEALACPVVFVDGATGAQGAETDGDLTYNPSTGTINATALTEGGTGVYNTTESDAAYQPLEATLTDIADGTISENLVNTTNPWADNEVSDTLTSSTCTGNAATVTTNANLTGDVTSTGNATDITESVLEDGGTDELAITAGMMNTGTAADATTFWRGDNTWVVPTASVAYDDIGNPDASGSIAMGAFTGTYTSATDGWGGVIIQNSQNTQTVTSTLVTLNQAPDAGAQSIFIDCFDDYDGTPNSVFQVGTNGAVVMDGGITAANSTFGSGAGAQVSTRYIKNPTDTDTWIRVGASDLIDFQAGNALIMEIDSTGAKMFGGKNFKLGDPNDCGTFTMIKGGQAGDPQVQHSLSADAEGDYTIAVDTGAFAITLGGGATDDFTVDSSTLVVESDTGFVGIGTVTPLAPLHVDIVTNPPSDISAIIIDCTNGLGYDEEMRLEWMSIGTFDYAYIGSALRADSEGYLTFATRISGTTTETMRIVGNRVGIGDTTPTTGGLVVAAGVTIGTDQTANLFDDASNGSGTTVMYIGDNTIDTTDPSDRRMKENIVASDIGLGNLMGLDVVDFNFKKEFRDDQSTRHGLIAQDVMAAYPYAVKERSDGYLMVDYVSIIPLLIKTSQEQQGLIEAQSKVIKALEKRLDKLEK